MKRILIYSILVSALCFLSFVLTYGYEEGTMGNHILGKISTFMFRVFKFPFGSILPSKYILLGLLLDVILYSTILKLILDRLNGLK